MEQTLLPFLNKYRVVKGESFTHTWIKTNESCSFNIPNDKEFELRQLYTNHLDTHANPKIYLTEKHQDRPQEGEQLCCILIDLDFKYKFDGHEMANNNPIRHVTTDMISTFTSCYITYLHEYFDVNSSDVEAFIFQREHPYVNKTVVKDGVHIMFPHIVTSPAIQFEIRERMIEDMSDIFNELPLINDYDDIFDKCVIASNNWYMYKSRKHGKKPYDLVRILNDEMENIPVSNYTNSDLVNLLSIRNKTEASIIRECKKVVIENYNKVIKIKTAINNVPCDLNDNEIELIKLLVGILNEKRADNEREWKEVGWCLYNISSVGTELFSIWDDFSKRSSKYRDGICEREWSRFKKGGLQLASLHYWAKNDNLDEYEKVIRTNMSSCIEISLSGTDYDIAMVVYHKYKHEYVYTPNKTWYEFKNHKWCLINDAMSLRKKLSTEVYRDYIHLLSNCNKNSLNQMLDEALRNEFKEKATKISKIAHNNLKNGNPKDNIIKECKELFYNADFLTTIDTNKYLLCFNNGVYDLKIHEFRDGRPDDYLTIGSNTAYIHYNANDPITLDVMTFFAQVFVDYDLREFVLTLLSSFMEGENRLQKFYFFIGESGANGKSVLLKLVEKTFGDYFQNIPVQLITRKRVDAESASPSLAKTMGCRFITFNEPNYNEKLNLGYMKELTGGDRLTARKLRQDPISFEPQFSMVMVSNYLPDIPGDDSASWRRICAIEFKSHFVKIPDESNRYEFKRDDDLMGRLGCWTEAFFSILIEYYKKYSSDGLVEPEAVTKYTEDYQRSCDAIGMFISTKVSQGGDTEYITLVNLYEHFKNWYIDEYDNRSVPNKKDFTSAIKKKTGKNYKNNRIYGYHLIVDKINIMTESDD
jgi:P4 family phage/plasmid primase-like protien